ncbi:hypothetical protein L1049_007613 [Liquidambar formosana]|uniref:Uncharacterized protein n=1 Tax=Liquidambar formosana TaxID=63359 RepID=A0AAP0S1R6_LIQFO
MASPKGTDASALTLPAAEGALNPGRNTSLEVDSVSSQVATSLEIKELYEAAQRENEMEKEREKRDAMQTLKTAVIVSGVIVAVAGAIFAITKKLKEK